MIDQYPIKPHVLHGSANVPDEKDDPNGAISQGCISKTIGKLSLYVGAPTGDDSNPFHKEQWDCHQYIPDTLEHP
jgi:hypothetical protein